MRCKLSAVEPGLTGYHLFLVDDGIVRSHMSCKIVSMALEAGTRKIIFSNCIPPIVCPYIYASTLPCPTR